MDEPWSRPEPQSPCRKVCVIESVSGLCIGCLRTIDEIAGWGGMTPEARRALIAELPGRQGRLSRRKGGRAARLGTRT